MTGAATPDTAGPPGQVVSEFGLSDPPRRLDRGSAAVFACGDLILKPGQREAFVAWLDRLADAAQPHPEFRLARPVRARDGAWTVAGWSAQTRLSGRHHPDGWTDVLAVSRSFHAAVAAVPPPADTTPWTLAHRAAWGELELPAPPALEDVVAVLTRLTSPMEAVTQLVHSDLCIGNVLFDDGLAPAILDVSPSVRPVRYAEAILLADAVIWEGAPLSLIEGWLETPVDVEMLVRACLFRLYAARILWRTDPDRLRRIADHHRPLAARLERWASRRPVP